MSDNETLKCLTAIKSLVSEKLREVGEYLITIYAKNIDNFLPGQYVHLQFCIKTPKSQFYPKTSNENPKIKLHEPSDVEIPR